MNFLRPNKTNLFSKSILTITFTILCHVFSANCQNIPGTGNGTTGIGHLSTGWYNANPVGTPDLSTCAFCILPICPWNTSPTNFTTINLPTPPNGDSLFADVFTPPVNNPNIEIIGTTITNLVPGNSYTVRLYLLTGLSSVASTNIPNSFAIFFPTSVEVTIDGIISVIPLDSTTHNKWKLFNFPFTAISNSASFKIGNPLPMPLGMGGGFVCISLAVNAISCSNNIYLGNDQAICTGDTLNLNAHVPNATYLWQDGSVNSNYPVTAPGTYFVIVSQPNCWYTDTINISYKPLPAVHLGNDTSLCSGNTLILDATTNDAQYNWQDNSTDPHYTVDHNGIYSVAVTVDGCTGTDSIEINFKPLPIVNLGEDATLCSDKTLSLDVAIPNSSYLWQDSSVNAQYTITKNGIYWIKLTSDGCENSDTIKVEFTDCDCILAIPNAFTPNGDGINDKWIIARQDCIAKIAVSVYNRYGSLIYHSDDYKSDWQGLYKSKNCPDATYYYIINLFRPGRTGQTLRGNVTILR